MLMHESLFELHVYLYAHRYLRYNLHYSISESEIV